MPRSFAVLVLACTMGAVSFPAAGQIADRPNVVLIMTDDAGYGDFGSYGAPDVRTPNIDAIGREGVRLTDFYANGATCTPTRAGLISGRYQQRRRLEAAVKSQGEADRGRGLPGEGGTMPRIL